MMRWQRTGLSKAMLLRMNNFTWMKTHPKTFLFCFSNVPRKSLFIMWIIFLFAPLQCFINTLTAINKIFFSDGRQWHWISALFPHISWLWMGWHNLRFWHSKINPGTSFPKRQITNYKTGSTAWVRLYTCAYRQNGLWGISKKKSFTGDVAYKRLTSKSLI